MKQNKYVEVMYELYVPNETGNWDIVEKTSKEHPLKFVTGMDFALEAFENQIQATAEGDTFDFVVPVAEAYGDYVDEHVISLDKSLFVVDGQFDEAHIFPGNVIPLANEDGTQFNAVVEEVQEDKVVVDLNHPLAGKLWPRKWPVTTSANAAIVTATSASVTTPAAVASTTSAAHTDRRQPAIRCGR